MYVLLDQDYAEAHDEPEEIHVPAGSATYVYRLGDQLIFECGNGVAHAIDFKTIKEGWD